MELPKYSVFGVSKMYMFITLLWMIAITKGQDCSTTVMTGWNVYGGYRYVIYDSPGSGRTFNNTRTHCQGLGGGMAVIKSAVQNNFISMFLKDDNGNYFIGLEDMDEDGNYAWIDGTSPGYDNWEEDGKLYANSMSVYKPYCAVMRSRIDVRGRWNRVACESPTRHICQIPLADGCRWKEIGDFQYLIQFTETATPSVARKSCQKYGGDLAIINNGDVNAFVKALLVPSLTASGTQTCYWFGLQKDLESFSWLDGTSLMYTDWKSGEPGNGDWGCIGLDDGSSWYGHSSTDQHPYICERTRDVVITSEASYGGRDYFLSHLWLARSFSDAQTYCRYHGGDLALIKSPDVNTFLHQKFSAMNRAFFIGLTDQANEGTFTWIDGTPLQYLAWMGVEPNNAGTNEDCTSLNPSRLNMAWNDIRCDVRNSFICERYHHFPEYKWSELDGTLYYVSQSSKTSFYFARKFCQEQGGDLAQPKTEEINDHLIHLAAGNSYWFGLSILTDPTPDIFQWIDETPLADNEFPSWSDFDESLFENEKCVHQNGNNGWRKLPCGSYLRFACEKPPRPRPVPPIHLVSATPTPYRGGLENSSYICLLGSEDEDILSLSTRRFFRLTQVVTFDSYEAPGVTSNVSSVALRQTLPPDTAHGFGFFECTSVTASKRTSTPLGVLLSTRRLQPTNGRLTITVHIGDNVTLNVMSTTGIQDGNGIRWRRLIDFDWTGSSGSIEESSNSLSHTIQSASLLDAGVYMTFIDGTLGDHRYSFIRLIVKECPFGRWNPPSCDRLCDNCYNGGICHELSGTCICPPGHAGKNCLRACGRHKFGWDCEFECGAGKLLDKCAESQICLPDPYGCNCLAGYTGIYCNETCTDGWYGADCRQSCHCADGRDCDDATGECPGDCSGDWSGPACQVPSLCPTGYFGSDCSQKCNCRNGTACNKDTGYCDEVEGLCDVGYVMNSVRFPSSCRAFSGCYGSCSKTCHCSNDTDDCNFLTGNCISSKCHPRWMGGQCQTDRFQTISEKTNPGVAIFHCSYTTSPESNHSSEYVMAAARMLSSDHLIRYHSSYVSTTSINNSFLHEYFGKEEPIYCYVGKPEDPSGFAFVRLPPREFFVLPSYSGTPEIAESGYYHAVVSWRQWDPEIDTGDGPIVGYKIYVRLGTKVIYDEEVLPPGVGLPGSPLRVLSRRSTDNATEMVTYNVTELEAGSTYAIQIAAIRDGIKGEGQSGPILTITTESHSVPVSLTTSISTDRSIQGGSQSGSSLVSAAAGGAVGAILFILIVIIVVIIVFKRRRNGTKSPVIGGIDHDIPSDLQDIPLDRVQRNRIMQDSQIDDGINASYVKGIHYNFLTTQMPMPSTVSDFCCMVLTNQPSTIVMLNDKIQADKSNAKYWSDQGKAKFGSYTVAILSTSSDDDMIVRQLMITSDRNTSHAVTQYQFLGWPSHRSDHQSGAWSLLKLIHAVKGSIDDKKEFPLLVHCLRDTGRTGVFCSALESIAKMEEGDSVDIFQTVRFLRANRMQFVQTEEEYSLLYDVVNAYMSSKDYEQMPYPINDHAYGNVETEDYALDMLEPEEITYEITDLQDGCASTHVYSNTEMEKIGQSRVIKSQEKYSVYENMELKS